MQIYTLFGKINSFPKPNYITKQKNKSPKNSKFLNTEQYK